VKRRRTLAWVTRVERRGAANIATENGSFRLPKSYWFTGRSLDVRGLAEGVAIPYLGGEHGFAGYLAACRRANMANSFQRCCAPGCGTLVHAELEAEGFCVLHYLLSAEKACTDMRRETAAGGSDATRRAEIESYVSTSAIKLALIGTGSVRLSDEIKKRVLTTFHTLMLLRENLDRTPNPNFPLRRTSSAEVSEVSTAA